MPGFDNSTLFFEEGLDPRGVIPVVNQMDVDGRFLIGSSAPPYVVCTTLTPGHGISITNGPGTCRIDATAGGFGYHEVTSATNPNTLIFENGYIAKGGVSVVFVLPAAATVGDTFRIVGHGNLWTLQQNAFQSVVMGIKSSTPGVGGSISASHIRDTVEIVCVTTDLEFQIVNSTGNIIFV